MEAVTRVEHLETGFTEKDDEPKWPKFTESSAGVTIAKDLCDSWCWVEKQNQWYVRAGEAGWRCYSENEVLRDITDTLHDRYPLIEGFRLATVKNVLKFAQLYLRVERPPSEGP